MAVAPVPRPVIYYVRHGETDWNAERRLQGQQDIPLNALGRQQANACGVILRDLLAREGVEPSHFDFVSSPLGRARETMQRMRTGLGLPPDDFRIDDRLKEMSFGRWEGFTFAELQADEGEGLAARERDKWGFVLPEGESYAQLVTRVADWHDSVTRDTIVAAHGGVYRALLVHLGHEPRETASLGEVGQGCVYLLREGGASRHD